MSAALIGVSFGGETVSLKMGREGKKSVEGSIAMFCVCFVLGMIAFAGRTLSEYAGTGIIIPKTYLGPIAYIYVYIFPSKAKYLLFYVKYLIFHIFLLYFALTQYWLDR